LKTLSNLLDFENTHEDAIRVPYILETDDVGFFETLEIDMLELLDKEQQKQFKHHLRCLMTFQNRYY